MRLVSVAVVATIAMAQSTPPDSARPGIPKFEVASIKPCKGVEPVSNARSGNLPNGGFSAGRMHLECSPLVGTGGLIRKAYGTFASGEFHAFLHPSALPVEGGPDWIRSEYYTIDAKAEGTPSVEMMQGPMLQAVLEDRFHLKVRRDTRPVPAYELTVAKGGPKLRPFDGSCKPVDYSKGSLIAQIEADGACPVAMRGQKIDAPGQTIGDFITFALTLLDRPVIDKTGLTGRYDIYVTLPPDDTPGPSDLTVTVALAIQQQLGLRLVSVKGPGAALVIEHVERPTPNVPTPAAAAHR